jgi:hypothetical protein
LYGSEFIHRVKKGWLPLIPLEHGDRATMHCLTTYLMITAINIATVHALINLLQMPVWCKICNKMLLQKTLPEGHHLKPMFAMDASVNGFKTSLHENDIGSDHGIDLQNESKAQRILQGEDKAVNTTMFLMVSSSYEFCGGAHKQRCHMGNEDVLLASLKRAMNTIEYVKTLIGISWDVLIEFGMPLPRPGMPGATPNARDVTENWPERTPPWTEFGSDEGVKSFKAAVVSEHLLFFKNPSIPPPSTL